MANFKKAQNIFSFMVVLSECSHIFCCVLPTIFSVMGVLVGLGLVGIMPVWMSGLHEIMHGYELPVIFLSGIVLLVGWVLHIAGKKLDCHDTGCVHGSCEPKKRNAIYILKIATFLFVINIFVYLIFHRGIEHIEHLLLK